MRADIRSDTALLTIDDRHHAMHSVHQRKSTFVGQALKHAARRAYLACALMCLTASATPAGAQTTPPSCFLQLVSAVPGLVDRAAVTLDEQENAYKPSNGIVCLTTSLGSHRLRIRALGAQPVDTSVILTSSMPIIRVTLTLAAQVLGTVQIVSSGVGKPARYAETTKFDSFYERRATAVGGKFLTREDLEGSGKSDVVDLLRTISGVRVMRTMNGDQVTKFERCGSSDNGSAVNPMRPTPGGAAEVSQTVQVFVDGIKVAEPHQVLGRLKTDDVEAIEVYRGVAELPSIARGNGCAAILVWTRYTSGSVKQ